MGPSETTSSSPKKFFQFQLIFFAQLNIEHHLKPL